MSKIGDRHPPGYLNIQITKAFTDHIKNAEALSRRPVLSGNDQSIATSEGQDQLLHLHTAVNGKPERGLVVTDTHTSSAANKDQYKTLSVLSDAKCARAQTKSEYS